VKQQHWLAFAAALTGSALLATGFGLAVDRAVSLSTPPPRLATVSTSVLTRAGYTLAPAGTPAYCGVEQAAAERGWVPGGSIGCPISRSAAVRAAPATVQEALLARVSAARSNPVGQDRLTWVVVIRPSFMLVPAIACVGPGVGGRCQLGPIAAQANQAVVFVDAHTGRIVEILPVSRTGPVPLPRTLPTPAGPGVPIRTLPVMPMPVTPIPAPSPVTGASGSGGQPSPAGLFPPRPGG
jgi:hypothetical protein